MTKTARFIGTASYVILGVPSLLLAGKTGDYGLMFVSFMLCALVVSTVLSAVAFSLARESQPGTSQPRSVLYRFELAVLGLPAFVGVVLVIVVILSMLVMFVTRLAS